jgi:hypothetical protein
MPDRLHRARTIRHCLLDALTISLARDADPINATECLISVPVGLRSLDGNPSNAGLSKVCLGPSHWRALNHDTLAARNRPRTSSRFGCGVCRIGLRRETSLERMARTGHPRTEEFRSGRATLRARFTQHAEDGSPYKCKGAMERSRGGDFWRTATICFQPCIGDESPSAKPINQIGTIGSRYRPLN